ncbi:hypothetical protein WUBG_14132, partial [Wuchereria bancrofti]
ANCCFSLPLSSLTSKTSSNIDNDLKTKSYVLLNRRLNRDDRSFSFSDKEDCHITNPVQVYGYNSTVGTVSDSFGSNYKDYYHMGIKNIFDGFLIEAKPEKRDSKILA